MTALIQGLALMVTLTCISYVRCSDVDAEKPVKVCCTYDRFTGHIYDSDNSKHYHIFVDNVDQKTRIADDSSWDVYTLFDLKSNEAYRINGTHCTEIPFVGSEFNQCVYAPPDMIKTFTLTVPQGDITVKSVYMKKDAEDWTNWFLYDIGGGLCFPLASSAVADGLPMHFFYSDMQKYEGTSHVTIGFDTSKCTKLN